MGLVEIAAIAYCGAMIVGGIVSLLVDLFAH